MFECGTVLLVASELRSRGDSPASYVMTDAGAPLAARSTQPLAPPLDLRREPGRPCAGGARLSPPLSSARRRELACSPPFLSIPARLLDVVRSQILHAAARVAFCRSGAAQPHGSPGAALGGTGRTSLGSAAGLPCRSPRRIGGMPYPSLPQQFVTALRWPVRGQGWSWRI